MKKEKNNHRDIDLKNYQDIDGLTVKKMNFGLWLSEHRRRLLRCLIIILILVSAGFFIYSSYYYIVYFITGQSNPSLLNNQVIYPRVAEGDLKIGPIQVLESNAMMDLAMQIENLNNSYSAIFQYCFVEANNQEFACNSSFILPGQTKYLLALGQSLNDPYTRPNFLVKNIFWQRVNLHSIPDWSDFARQRLDFLISDLSVTNGSRSGLTNQTPVNNVSFNITNQNTYAYYQVPLHILFYSGSELVGVQYYLVKDFLSDQSRAVNISWLGKLPTITKTEVQPDINILDNSIYLKYQGASQ